MKTELFYMKEPRAGKYRKSTHGNVRTMIESIDEKNLVASVEVTLVLNDVIRIRHLFGKIIKIDSSYNSTRRMIVAGKVLRVTKTVDVNKALVYTLIIESEIFTKEVE